MKSRRPKTIPMALVAGAVLAFLGAADAQQIHRNSFEVREPLWMRGPTDATFRELAHEMTDATAHTGQRSEHLLLTSEQGTHIYYHYATGRAPVTEDLNLSLWLKANRPGAQLLARVVLPRERNPANLDEPLTTLVRGDVYQRTSRWQRLELGRVVKLTKEQQTLMRAQLQRDVDFTDAYVDRIVLNAYSGPGQTELWIDDLEIGPVLDTSPFQPTSRPKETKGREETPEAAPRTPNRAALVELNQDQLLVNGRRFFFRGIRHTDTPLKVLRDAGFNTLWCSPATAPSVLEDAVNQGFWIVPSFSAAEEESAVDGAIVSRDVARFLERDAVLFWDLGGGLMNEQAAATTKVAELVRAADPQRPRGADVWDGFRSYARQLDVLGIHRWPLMTGMELGQYRDWLNQRRLLAYRSPFVWTWVQTHLPDWYTTLVYDQPGSASFNEPIGPQPEQIRLLTYVALSAGCRGIAFWSDRFLADSHQGRDRLLCLALLNQELRMLEPLLVAMEPPIWIDTSIQDVKAAVLRTEKGVLVLPIWLGKGAQFVPGQEAAVSLSMTVPQVPPGTQAWEVSPGEVRSLRAERVLGGTKVTVPEFSLTAAVVFTADHSGLVVRFQDQARQTRQSAAQWSYNLAELELDKVVRVETELERQGHTLPDAQALLNDARRRLQTTAQFYNGGDFRQAYLEAQRVLRPLRILMRAQWEAATKELDTPVASPYAVSFFTLPRQWEFMGRVRKSAAGGNLLPAGSFELIPGSASESWALQQTTLDPVTMTARRVTENAKEGQQCMMLKIQPKDPQAPLAALERTFLAITSPTVRLDPGQLVRISGWIRIPENIGASADGALLYDSAGGEPLGIRLTQKVPAWKQFTLYRQVPASGAVNVTLALTGLGTVYFDDIRIEPLDGRGENQPTRQAPAISVSRDRASGNP
jgi:hypothetical protein